MGRKYLRFTLPASHRPPHCELHTSAVIRLLLSQHPTSNGCSLGNLDDFCYHSCTLIHIDYINIFTISVSTFVFALCVCVQLSYANANVCMYVCICMNVKVCQCRCICICISVWCFNFATFCYWQMPTKCWLPRLTQKYSRFNKSCTDVFAAPVIQHNECIKCHSRTNGKCFIEKN